MQRIAPRAAYPECVAAYQESPKPDNLFHYKLSDQLRSNDTAEDVATLLASMFPSQSKGGDIMRRWRAKYNTGVEISQDRYIRQTRRQARSDRLTDKCICLRRDPQHRPLKWESSRPTFASGASRSSANGSTTLGRVVAPDKEAAIAKAMDEFRIGPARRFRLIVVPVE